MWYKLQILLFILKNYLLNFKYTFKVIKIIDFNKSNFDLFNTQIVVIQLFKKFLKLRQYYVYIDNFFTNDKLTYNVKEIDCALINICKTKSSISTSLLKLKKVFIKKNWNLKAITTEKIIEITKKITKKTKTKKLNMMLCVI